MHSTLPTCSGAFRQWRKVLFLVAYSLCLGTFAASAQQSVAGLVTDDTGEPLIGVNVLEIGTTNGTVTDFDGRYELTVAENAVLEFTYTGYEAQRVEVSNRSEVNLRMQSGVQLDEVTVTALGVERKTKALGYAVQEVGGEAVSDVKSPNMLDALSGKVAGVQIVSGNSGPGSSARITIRGESSLAGNNQPLFVIDGVPVSNETDNRTASSGIASNLPVDYGNGAAEINPDDIETISVLKGANATALYGSRAANGVVLITTKSGKNRRGIGVSFQSSTSFETPLASPEYQRVYGQGKNEQFEFVDGYGSGTFDGVDESWGPRMDGRLIRQFDGPTTNGLRGGDVHGLDFILGPSGVDLDRRGDIEPTPWIDYGDPVDQFFETGHTLSNNLSFYGGNDQGNFRLSYTNFNNRGMLPNTDLERNTVSGSFGYNLTERLSVDFRANYVRSDSDNRHVNNYGTESIMYLFTWLGQQLDLSALRDYWQTGLEGFQQFNYNYNYHDNPYFTLYENTNGLEKNRVFGNISATYKILPNLSLMFRTGGDIYSELRRIKRAYSTQRFPRGQYREDKINFTEFNTDFLLSYNTVLSEEFELNVSAGANRMVQKSEFHAVSANQLVIPEVYTFTNTDVPLVTAISRPEKQINSVYGFAQLSYRSMVFLDLTARNDWSSTLPKDNNSYFYPSVSFSAVVSDLLNIPTNSALSFAKLRLGWAQVGNDTDPYRLIDPFTFGQPWGSNLTASPSNTISNRDLKPEIMTSYEAGLDIRFFNNRLGLDATYYQNDSRNQILAIDIPHSSGYTSRVINAGKIRNYGLELMLNATPIKASSGFRWDAFVNFSLNRNQVVELPEGVDEYVLGGNGVTLIAREGGALGDMYGTGFRQVTEPGNENFGRIIFSNGLPVESNELRLLGNYNPDFLLGFSNEFSYKGFSLSFLLDWRQGGELFSRTRLIAATAGNVVETLWGRAPEFGGPHPGISDSGLTWEDPADGQTYTDGIIGDGVKEIFDSEGRVVGYEENDRIVHASAYHNKRYKRQNEEEGMYDATFLKLREARLSYSLPATLLASTFLEGVRLSLIGRNLLLFTDFNHGDPELLSQTGGGFVPGVENMAVPTARSLGFSVNVTF